MSSNATKEDIQLLSSELNAKIDKSVDDISSIITDFSQQVAGEFNKVNERIDKIEQSIDRLTNTLDGFAKQVSKKTGIPLPVELS